MSAEIIDFAEQLKRLSDLDEYADFLAEQYENNYCEPPKEASNMDFRIDVFNTL